MARICLITPGQISTNPRLVKEADALAAAGHAVHVISSRGASWVEENDRRLQATRSWSCTYVGGKLTAPSRRYLLTRARHRMARASRDWPIANAYLDVRAISRVGPDLRRAALSTPADLYIAHYPAALPAAADAARTFSARFAYDAEDLYAAESESPAGGCELDRTIARVEERYIGECAYVSASSPEIARAYSRLYSISPPVVLLNVFPLAHRPHEPRPQGHDDVVSLYWFSQTIGPSRGIEDVIRAMGSLADPRVVLHLRGMVSPGYADSLADLAAATGVAREQLVFHAPAEPDDMVRLASQHDIGLAAELPVSRSRDLCLTNKLFTYVLAGNAVAGTTTEAQRPVLETLGEAAVSYAPGDSDGLAMGIRRWLQDPIALWRARSHAWQLGTQRYNWDVEQATLLDLTSKALLS